MSKRICVVINNMEQGGVASSVKNFCSQALNLDYQVDFLNMGGESYCDYIKGLNIIRLSGLRKIWNLTSSTYRHFSVVKKVIFAPIVLLKSLTNRYGRWLQIVFHGFSLPVEYDCVFAYNQCEPCYFFALHCIKARKKIAVIHGDINFMGDITSWSYMLEHFDSVACVSDAVKLGFINSFPTLANKFCTLYNMFDIDDIKRKALESPSVVFDNSVVNIISVSRHDNAHKAVNRIPEICYELLSRSIDHFHWYIVGGGKDYQYNQLLAAKLGVDKFITFCGPQDNPFALIKQADFMVLTSYTESYGMVLKEAQILGVPSVVAIYPSVIEVVDDNINSLIGEQNVKSLSEKVADMILNRDNVRTRLTDNLRESSSDNSKAISQFIQLVGAN